MAATGEKFPSASETSTVFKTATSPRPPATSTLPSGNFTEQAAVRRAAISPDCVHRFTGVPANWPQRGHVVLRIAKTAMECFELRFTQTSGPTTWMGRGRERPAVDSHHALTGSTFDPKNPGSRKAG